MSHIHQWRELSQHLLVLRNGNAGNPPSGLADVFGTAVSLGASDFLGQNKEMSLTHMTLMPAQEGAFDVVGGSTPIHVSFPFVFTTAVSADNTPFQMHVDDRQCAALERFVQGLISGIEHEESKQIAVWNLVLLKMTRAIMDYAIANPGQSQQILSMGEMHLKAAAGVENTNGNIFPAPPQVRGQAKPQSEPIGRSTSVPYLTVVK